jgi:hypothetical protein
MTSGAIMTGSPAQGIRTVPHPVSGPAAKAAYTAVTSPAAYRHVPDIGAELAGVTAAGASAKEPAHAGGNVPGLIRDR